MSKFRKIPFDLKEAEHYTVANQDRSDFMKEAHKDPARKEISRKAGKLGGEGVKHWRKANPEQALENSRKGRKKSIKTMAENDIGLWGLTKEERVINASLGGNAKTEKQIAARKKQQAEHFRPAGAKAAAKKKIAKYKKIAKEFYDLCPDGWFHINDVEHLKHSTSAKSISVRNTLNRYPELFKSEFKVINKGKKQLWKKI